MELFANGIVQSLDSVRSVILRTTLRIRILRKVYRLAHYRLAVGMLLSTAIYLPLAFLSPELLLAFGPLIFGYPHLIASYRFTTKLKNFHLFVFVTVIALALHMSQSDYPFGVWQILVATATFILYGLISRSIGPWQIAAALFICTISIRLAWLEPIMYVGATLIIHNFIGFFHWIKTARTKPRKTTALLSTVLFLVIHLFVLSGLLDSWIPTQFGLVSFSNTTEKTSWLLASWTDDKIVWYRFLVMYAFGLSIHYFVWLRAIPESLSEFDHPNSFRRIVMNLKQDLGKKTLVVSVLAMLAGIIVWLLSQPLGARIYFEVAILHGALEMVYLVGMKRSLPVQKS